MTRAAANGHAPRFDLDAAAKAAATEASSAPFAFAYQGSDYEVLPAASWPLAAQQLIGKGELEPALVMLLGQAQFDQLVSAGITIGELGVLFEAIGEAAGLGGLPNLPQPALPGSTPT